MTLVYLGTFASALLLAFVLTRYVRDYATARGWVAAPGSQRHLHTEPRPRLGGVAILISFGGGLIVASLAGLATSSLRAALSLKDVTTILLPGLLIFLLGIYDDLHGIGAYWKFALEAVAATLLFAGGLQILDLPVLFGSQRLPWFVGLPLTILWVLGITNAFNLIDGLDGLAAGSALFSTLVVFVVALLSHSGIVSTMAIALTGAILGFLRYNFNPATIFLGDCGSLFIGFMLSALALRGAQKAPTIIAVAIPVVSFGLPILETTLSVLRRFISGRPVFTADREHIHHKLLERGLSHRQVVIVLYAVSALFGLLSLFLLWPTGSTLGLVLAVLGCGIWIGVQHLGYLEFGELRRVAQRTIEQRQIVVNNLAVRRATEELRVARDYPQLCKVLIAAFSSNDFDGFDLQVDAPKVGDYCDLQLFHNPSGGPQLRWRKPGSQFARGVLSSWSLSLDLITTNHQPRGSLIIYRAYSTRDLQLDINLLTSIFPVALADALERVVCASSEPLLEIPEMPALVVARAG